MGASPPDEPYSVRNFKAEFGGNLGVKWLTKAPNQLLRPLQKQGNVWKRFSYRWLTNLCYVAIMLNSK